MTEDLDTTRGIYNYKHNFHTLERSLPYRDLERMGKGRYGDASFDATLK